MDEDDIDESSDSVLIARYDSGHPFAMDVLELRHCNECGGMFKDSTFQLIVGMYIPPVGQEAIKRRDDANKHNRSLDDLFRSSEKCLCHGRNTVPKWLGED